jgi:hypothetical protein
VTRREKLRAKCEHLYMFYEILMPVIEQRNYGEEYYWHARYYMPLLVPLKKGKIK